MNILPTLSEATPEDGLANTWPGGVQARQQPGQGSSQPARGGSSQPGQPARGSSQPGQGPARGSSQPGQGSSQSSQSHVGSQASQGAEADSHASQGQCWWQQVEGSGRVQYPTVQGCRLTDPRDPITRVPTTGTHRGHMPVSVPAVALQNASRPGCQLNR